MLDIRTLQRHLAAAGHYYAKIDGIWGNASRAAQNAFLTASGIEIGSWDDARRHVALNQLVLARTGQSPGPIDGLRGPSTDAALENFLNAERDLDPLAGEVAHQPRIWPRQKDVPAFYGRPGTNLIHVDLPYRMKLAWDEGTTISRMLINRKCADSAVRAFAKVLDHYGEQRIGELGLDVYGGCFNDRNVRGGTRKSMHAYGCAIDIDPLRNRFRWASDKARLSKPDCAAFLDAFAEEGWINMGRERNFDWMHLQAARL